MNTNAPARIISRTRAPYFSGELSAVVVDPTSHVHRVPPGKAPRCYRRSGITLPATAPATGIPARAPTPAAALWSPAPCSMLRFSEVAIVFSYFQRAQAHGSAVRYT
jgi:hypothetical protein